MIISFVARHVLFRDWSVICVFRHTYSRRRYFAHGRFRDDLASIGIKFEENSTPQSRYHLGSPSCWYSSRFSTLTSASRENPRSKESSSKLNWREYCEEEPRKSTYLCEILQCSQEYCGEVISLLEHQEIRAIVHGKRNLPQLMMACWNY